MEIRNSVWGTEEPRYQTLFLRQGSISVMEKERLKVNHSQIDAESHR